MRKVLLACALALAVGACSSDEIAAVGPDPQNCTKGSVKVGDTKTGSIGSSSCAMYDWYWEGDSVNFESYNVRVEKGKGYLFTLGGDDPADRKLGMVSGTDLFGDSVSLYAAVQEAYDDEGGKPAQLFFVAPRTGVYSLRVFNGEVGDSFDYTLTARECEPKQVDIIGSYSNDTASLGEDDCTVAEPYFTYASRGGSWGYAPTHVALYTVNFDGNRPRRITVQSDDFSPAFMVMGPGLDAWCNTYYCAGNSYNNYSFADSLSATFDMWMPGSYTLTVGSMQPGATGHFKISISEPLSSDALVLRTPPEWGTLLPGQWKKMTGPR